MGDEQQSETIEEQEQALDIGLWRAGAVALFAAVLSNIIAHFLLSWVLIYPPDFIPLRPTSIAILTAFGAFGATLLYARLRGRVEQPERTFQRVAWLLLALSIVPALTGALSPGLFPLPGATSSAFLTLIPFHLIAGVVIIGLLSRLHEP